MHLRTATPPPHHHSGQFTSISVYMLSIERRWGSLPSDSPNCTLDSRHQAGQLFLWNSQPFTYLFLRHDFLHLEPGCTKIPYHTYSPSREIYIPRSLITENSVRSASHLPPWSSNFTHPTSLKGFSSFFVQCRHRSLRHVRHFLSKGLLYNLHSILWKRYVRCQDQVLSS